MSRYFPAHNILGPANLCISIDYIVDQVSRTLLASICLSFSFRKRALRILLCYLAYDWLFTLTHLIFNGGEVNYLDFNEKGRNFA